MISKARPVSKAPDEGLRPVGGPVVPVVECGGVEDCFEENLGDANGVRGGAGPVGFEGARGGVGHVGHVVGGVEVLAVPASGSISRLFQFCGERKLSTLGSGR